MPINCISVKVGEGGNRYLAMPIHIINIEKSITHRVEMTFVYQHSSHTSSMTSLRYTLYEVRGAPPWCRGASHSSVTLSRVTRIILRTDGASGDSVNEMWCVFVHSISLSIIIFLYTYKWPDANELRFRVNFRVFSQRFWST